MADHEAVTDALEALAAGHRDHVNAGSNDDSGGPVTDEYTTVIARAVDATDDLDAAVTFLEDTGLERLEAAVERAEAEVSGKATAGRDALAAFRRYRAVARGDHFHRGRDTTLGGGDQEPPK